MFYQINSILHLNCFFTGSEFFPLKPSSKSTFNCTCIIVKYLSLKKTLKLLILAKTYQVSFFRSLLSVDFIHKLVGVWFIT